MARWLARLFPSFCCFVSCCLTAVARLVFAGIDGVDGVDSTSKRSINLIMNDDNPPALRIPLATLGLIPALWIRSSFNTLLAVLLAPYEPRSAASKFDFITWQCHNHERDTAWFLFQLQVIYLNWSSIGPATLNPIDWLLKLCWSTLYRAVISDPFDWF